MLKYSVMFIPSPGSDLSEEGEHHCVESRVIESMSIIYFGGIGGYLSHSYCWEEFAIVIRKSTYTIRS